MRLHGTFLVHERLQSKLQLSGCQYPEKPSNYAHAYLGLLLEIEDVDLLEFSFLHDRSAPSLTVLFQETYQAEEERRLVGLQRSLRVKRLRVWRAIAGGDDRRCA